MDDCDIPPPPRSLPVSDHRRYTGEEMEEWRAMGYTEQEIWQALRTPTVTEDACSYLYRHGQRVPYQGQFLPARVLKAREQLEGRTAKMPCVAVYSDESHSQLVRCFTPQEFIDYINSPECEDLPNG